MCLTLVNTATVTANGGEAAKREPYHYDLCQKGHVCPGGYLHGGLLVESVGLVFSGVSQIG